MIASRNETQIGQNYPWVGGRGSIYHYLGPLGPDFLLSRLESARTDESVWSDSWAQPWEFLVRNSLPPPPHPPAPIPPPPPPTCTHPSLPVCISSQALYALGPYRPWLGYAIKNALCYTLRKGNINAFF